MFTLSHLKRYGYSAKTGYYIYNGIDRVNSDLGYSVKNCVTCCKDCNTAKMNMSIKDFLSMIERIYKKHFKNK